MKSIPNNHYFANRSKFLSNFFLKLIRIIEIQMFGVRIIGVLLYMHKMRIVVKTIMSAVEFNCAIACRQKVETEYHLTEIEAAAVVVAVLLFSLQAYRFPYQLIQLFQHPTQRMILQTLPYCNLPTITPLTTLITIMVWWRQVRRRQRRRRQQPLPLLPPTHHPLCYLVLRHIMHPVSTSPLSVCFFYQVAKHMRYLAKTNSCTGLYSYSLNRGLTDTHMRHVPHTYLCQHSSSLMCGKYRLFLGMTNTEGNLLSLGRALRYTLFVIFQIFTKCCICVAACD